MRAIINKAALVLYLGYVAANAVYATSTPAFNWDVIPYAACAISYEERDPRVVHERAYGALRRAAPPEVYEELTTSSAYRARMADVPQLFDLQLNYYHIRPLYVSLVFVASRIGVPVVTATVLVSALAAVAISLLSLVWLARSLPIGVAALIAWLLVNATGMTDLSRLSTPDILSAALVVGGLYLLIARHATDAGIAVLIGSLLARSDNVLLVLGVLACLAVCPDDRLRPGRRRLVLYAILALVVFVAIFLIARGYGWWTTVSHTLLGSIDDPTTYDRAPTLYLYAFVVNRGFKQFTSSHVAFMLLFAVLSFVFAGRDQRAPLYFIAAVLVTLVVRFFLFPVLWDRLFLAYYFVIPILFVGIATARLPRGAA